MINNINSISFKGGLISKNPIPHFMRNRNPLTRAQLRHITDTLLLNNVTTKSQDREFFGIFGAARRHLITENGTRILEERTPFRRKLVRQTLFVGNTNVIDCVREFKTIYGKTFKTVFVFNDNGTKSIATYDYSPIDGALLHKWGIAKDKTNTTFWEHYELHDGRLYWSIEDDHKKGIRTLTTLGKNNRAEIVEIQNLEGLRTMIYREFDEETGLITKDVNHITNMRTFFKYDGNNQLIERTITNFNDGSTIIENDFKNGTFKRQIFSKDAKIPSYSAIIDKQTGKEISQVAPS